MSTTTTNPSDDPQPSPPPPSRALLRCLFGKPADYITKTGSVCGGICYSFDGKQFLLFAPNTSKPGSKIPLSELEKIIYNGRTLTPSCDLWNRADDSNEGKIL